MAQGKTFAFHPTAVAWEDETEACSYPAKKIHKQRIYK